MKPQKKSIRDFFTPVARNPSAAATSQTTLPQRRTRSQPGPLPQANRIITADANNAPNHPPNPPNVSQVVQDANSHVVHTPLSSSDPPVSSASSTTRVASADAPPLNPSQTSANLGASKRTMSNGRRVVPDSESDDDSLSELEFGTPTSKVKIVPTTTRTRPKRMFEDHENGLKKPTKKAKDTKFDFDTLLKTAHRNLETELQIQEHTAALDKALEEPLNTTSAINEEILGQAVDDDDDPDKAHRLFQAMQRTNATQMECTYHFFQDASDSIRVQPKFPISSLSGHGWVSSFKDSHARDQAFMAGFAQQIFRIQKLPQELASWMIDQISTSTNDALSRRYIEILVEESPDLAHSHTEHIRTLLDIERLEALFRTMGANISQCKAKTELVPVPVPRSKTRSLLPPQLTSVVRFVGQAAPWLRSRARRRALLLLCHVCLDDRVIANPNILHTIQDAIEAVVCSIENHQMTSAVGSSSPQRDVQTLISSQLSDVVPNLLIKVTHPLLQRNLVCSFPAESPLTAYLQRHLALAFLVHPTPVNVPLSDPKVPDMIHKLLERSPNFRISKDTNYEHLAARLVLLDIAIGPGLLNVPYQPLSSPATSEAGSSPVRAPVPASSDVKGFNNEVDALARQFQLLSNTIVEAGAAVDLTIMDAKDSIERLRARLEYAVRIGGKKIYSLFGDEDEGTQLKVHKFFPKTERKPMSIFEKEDAM